MKNDNSINSGNEKEHLIKSKSKPINVNYFINSIQKHYNS